MMRTEREKKKNLERLKKTLQASLSLTFPTILAFLSALQSVGLPLSHHPASRSPHVLNSSHNSDASPAPLITA